MEILLGGMRGKNKTAKPGYGPFQRRDTGYVAYMRDCEWSAENQRKDERTT